jgi:hypothetical protein
VDAAVNTLDLFATCAAIGGVTGGNVPTAHDSKSLIPYLDSATASPQRPFVFTESQNPKTGSVDVAVARSITAAPIPAKLVKLIVKGYDKDKLPNGTSRQMYNLTDDPWEKRDLYVYGGWSIYESTLKLQLSKVSAGFR